MSSVKPQVSSPKAAPGKGGEANFRSTDTKGAPARLDQQGQVDLFGQAMKLFHARQFAEAAPMFERAAAGPAPDIAHTARTHLTMCERRLGQNAVKPKTAEEHYAAGVALLNRGDLGSAFEHLRQALMAEPGADHYHYIYALCAGLQGDLSLCAQHLQQAIELQPANRGAARSDPDWAPLARQSPIRELLHPERRESA
jgi:tetratricopeptide (TPR) repeat protein